MRVDANPSEIYRLLGAIAADLKQLKTSARDLDIQSARIAGQGLTLDHELGRVSGRLDDILVDMRAIAGAVEARFGNADAR